MEKKLYPGDITREQFAKILPILESARKKTSPRTLDLYNVFNAILYILKTGCQWRALPKEFPDYRNVHYYFTIWRNTKILDRVLKKLTGEVRQNNGRNSKTSFIIIDA
jgi:transposase